MVGCTPLYQDENCLWIVERINPTLEPSDISKLFYQHDFTHQEVWYGDIVRFKHVSTGAYLSLRID